jgi:hypothetical protein
MLMIDDWLLSILWAAWMAASTMPLGLMLGAPCSPCCQLCQIADDKPRTDPKDEGTWVPSGTWRPASPGVTWTFVANPGDESGETWFFFGSAATSRLGGNATIAQQRSWANICNWYSNKTTAPNDTTNLATVLNKRATRLPPADAIVHIYGFNGASTAPVGPVTLKHLYVWSRLTASSEVTTTAVAHDSVGGAVVSGSVDSTSILNGGATFFGSGSVGTSSVINGGAIMSGTAFNSATINGGATMYDSAENRGGTINGGAEFNNSSRNFVSGAVKGIVNGGAVFNDSSQNNIATVNDGAVFNGTSKNGTTSTADHVVNGGATFNDNSVTSGEVNGGAVFNDNALNERVVNGGAVFNGNAVNGGAATVNGGATFNDNSENRSSGGGSGGAIFNDSSVNILTARVNDGAVFNDDACSLRSTGDFLNSPCDRKFVAHPTDLPTCNGNAPDGCQNAADTCGCG